MDKAKHNAILNSILVSNPLDSYYKLLEPYATGDNLANARQAFIDEMKRNVDHYANALKIVRNRGNNREVQKITEVMPLPPKKIKDTLTPFNIHHKRALAENRIVRNTIADANSELAMMRAERNAERNLLASTLRNANQARRSSNRIIKNYQNADRRRKNNLRTARQVDQDDARIGDLRKRTKSMKRAGLGVAGAGLTALLTSALVLL